MSASDRNPGDFEFGPGHPATVTSVRPGRRWLLIALIVLGAAAIAAYLYLYQRPALQQVMDKVPVDLPGQQTEVYKWRDAEGNWHITDRKPPGDTPYETLRYDSDANVMPLAPRED